MNVQVVLRIFYSSVKSLDKYLRPIHEAVLAIEDLHESLDKIHDGQDQELISEKVYGMDNKMMFLVYNWQYQGVSMDLVRQ